MWIDELKENQIDLSLERMRDFMKGKIIDYRIVHVGGTNGKGSVSRFIYSILRRKYSTGIYTSPHLNRINERIVVDDEEIGNEEIEEYAFLRNHNFTYFEALTAMAILYFADRKVDYAIMEVGMGGRLDATNVLPSYLTIITNVSMEHERYLGKNISSIAREKAGIIKEAPVITACKGKALKVIKKIARERGVEIYVIGEDVKWRKTGKGKFTVESGEKYELETKMPGIFQGENIAMAVKAGEILGMSKDDIIEGVKNAEWPGRMERIGKFLLDGCHNPAAVSAFSASLEDFDFDELVIIFGVMRDKNVATMIENLPEAKAYIATGMKNERAMKAEEIAEVAKGLGRKFFISGNVKDAIAMAEKMAGKNDLICIIGSLYLVGEARKILESKVSSISPFLL